MNTSVSTYTQTVREDPHTHNLTKVPYWPLGRRCLGPGVASTIVARGSHLKSAGQASSRLNVYLLGAHQKSGIWKENKKALLFLTLLSNS